MDVAIHTFLTLVGLAMLCFGGNWLVSGGVAIAKKLRVSNMVIGMTVVAYGTSTPELAASIAASVGHGEIVVGNIVGSNIANIGMVVGFAAIIIPLVVNQTSIRRELLIMLGVSILLIALSLDGNLSHYDGIVLLVSLGVFAIFSYKDAKKNREKDHESLKDTTSSVYLKAIGLILLLLFLEPCDQYTDLLNRHE